MGITLERNFTREYNNSLFYKRINKRKIGVLSLGEGSGATFIATSIAFETAKIGDPVTFVELTKSSYKKSLIYNTVNVEKRFSIKKYENIYSQIENERNFSNRINMEQGINWVFLSPEEKKRDLNLTPLQEVKLINNVLGNYIICDFGRDFNESVLSEMDIIICVIDPLPSKLIENESILRDLVKKENVVWLVNKYNKGVNKRVFKRFLRLNDYYIVEAINIEEIYKMEYNCRYPYEQKNIKIEIQPIIEKIVKKHIVFTLG